MSQFSLFITFEGFPKLAETKILVVPIFFKQFILCQLLLLISKFPFSNKIDNFLKLSLKGLCDNILKRKILCLSKPIVMVYNFFSEDTIHYPSSVNLLIRRRYFYRVTKYRQMITFEKCEMSTFFVCSSWLSWYLTFFPKTLSKVHKFAYKTEIFL